MTGIENDIPAATKQADTARVPELAVVVPVHNEAENIASLIGEIREALDGTFDYEIVYVDDCSQDETAEKLSEIGAGVEHLRVLRHRERTGQSAAIATGIRAARAPVIATLDGDGQNDPGDIPALVDRFRQAENSDTLMVAGHRAERRDTLVKRLSSRIANGVRRNLLGDGTPDTGCGLKVFPRAAFLDMPVFNHMHRFLPALMLRQGGQVVSVKVNHRHRAGGATKYGVFDRLWVGITDILGVMWLKRRSLSAEFDEMNGPAGRGRAG